MIIVQKQSSSPLTSMLRSIRINVTISNGMKWGRRKVSRVVEVRRNFRRRKGRKRKEGRKIRRREGQEKERVSSKKAFRVLRG